MTALLRFSSGHHHDPRVPAWFDEHAPALVALVRPWFDVMRACGPDVRELVHDGCPVVCVDAAPFAYVHVYSAHAAVGFFHGAQLPDPEHLLQGTGKHMRHVKLRPDAPVPEAALKALIAAAYADIRDRLAADAAATVD
jgi:hypothetical protein